MEKTVDAYKKLFNEFYIYEIQKKDMESSHEIQDKIYRRFIKDISSGKLKSLSSIKTIANIINKKVIKYDVKNKRWYA